MTNISSTTSIQLDKTDKLSTECFLLGQIVWNLTGSFSSPSSSSSSSSLYLSTLKIGLLLLIVFSLSNSRLWISRLFHNSTGNSLWETFHFSLGVQLSNFTPTWSPTSDHAFKLVRGEDFSSRSIHFNGLFYFNCVLRENTFPTTVWHKMRQFVTFRLRFKYPL